MKHTMVITALMLALAVPVTSLHATETKVFELSLSDVRLPRAEGGTIGYKSCTKCRYATKRVGAKTLWQLNGQATSLKNFQRAAASVSEPENHTIQVKLDVDQDRVIKVWMIVR